MLWKQIEIPGDSSREGLFIHEQSDCSEADGRRAETLTLCETLLPESSDFVFCLPGATQGLTPLRTAILKDPSMLLLFFLAVFYRVEMWRVWKSVDRLLRDVCFAKESWKYSHERNAVKKSDPGIGRWSFQ